MNSWRFPVAGLATGLLLIGASAQAADEKLELMIEFAEEPTLEVTEDPDTGEETFFGTYTGWVSGDDNALLAGTEASCEFDGYTFEARGFSCGFTTAEKVSGRCLFTDDQGNTAVAEWECQTGASLTSDARCEGKAVWVDGVGKFAGITGEARFHGDLFLDPTEGYSRWRGHWSVPSLAMLTN